MGFLNSLIESIFPDKCVGCGTRGVLVCDSCIKKIPPSLISEHSFITSIFSYTDQSVRKLIHKLKYKNGQQVAKIFSPYLLSTLTEFLGEEKLFHGKSPVLLVPVPITKSRYKKRGYNQSELLINKMMKIDSNQSFCLENNLVRKIKETAPQAEIKKRADRLMSQKECFGVMPNKRTKNEIIVLIDDVTTTGATLCEIRDVLKQEGFKKVYALTVAH
jgi:competence protein ComFC